MGKYIFLLFNIWSEIQNHFLKLMIFLSAKCMIFSFVKFNSSSHQFPYLVTSENLIQPDDPGITQLLATN